MRRLLDAIGLGRELVAERYRLLEPFGACGPGRRFAARDEATGERVMVLLLPEAFAGPHTAARLVRLDVGHGDARILRPHDSGVDERGRPFTVTRHVDGELLTDVLARGIPPWSRTFELLEDLCDMLAAAHRRGLCHGSLEPGRILVGDSQATGGPWLLDFGLSHALVRPGPGEAAFPLPGAPEYAAPELLAGRSPTALSDLYSLAAIAWELVAGAPPFTGSPREVVDAHRHRPVPELVRRGDAPVEVEALLSIALAKQPDERFADALELVEALRGIEASSSGVWSLSSLEAHSSGSGATLSPTTELRAMLRSFSVVELRATRELIDKLLAARGE